MSQIIREDGKIGAILALILCTVLVLPLTYFLPYSSSSLYNKIPTICLIFGYFFVFRFIRYYWIKKGWWM